MILEAKYTCDKIPFTVDLSSQNTLIRDSLSNGSLELDGEKREIIATLGTDLRIYDQDAWNGSVADAEDPDLYYTAEWADGSLWFICDVALDFDAFTATVRPEYQGLFADGIQTFSFHRVP